MYLVFAFLISMTWCLPGASQYVPHWLEELIYPIDKVNLDVLRFAHFLALAVVTIPFLVAAIGRRCKVGGCGRRSPADSIPLKSSAWAYSFRSRRILP